MENPQTWGRLEREIEGALVLSHERQEKGIIGLSTVRIIADTLREAGLVKTENPRLRIASFGDDMTIFLNDEEIASANHDEHGWAGISALEEGVIALAEALGVPVERD